MSHFGRDDRVYHRAMKRYGTYVMRHDWGGDGDLEVSSYVLFDGDENELPVLTVLLDKVDPQ